jgi:hypothetical protein
MRIVATLAVFFITFATQLSFVALLDSFVRIDEPFAFAAVVCALAASIFFAWAEWRNFG